LRIPKRFKLLGHTIEITYDDEMFIENDALGFASFRTNKIILKTSSKMCPLSKSQLEQIFWHEFMHWILFFSGAANSGKCEHLHMEEELVDLSANLLHQALNSFEYKD
jgi:hypothetical protein